MSTELQRLLSQNLARASPAHVLDRPQDARYRSARDGYGGGDGDGCGGFEVFGFLAFLIALLDLLLELNDTMDEGDGARGIRDVARVLEEDGARGILDVAGVREDDDGPLYTHNLDIGEGIWAAGELAMGVLRATSTTHNLCTHAHLCHTTARIARRGPLPAILTRLAGEWLERWPGLERSQLGQVTRKAANTLTCPPIQLVCS